MKGKKISILVDDEVLPEPEEHVAADEELVRDIALPASGFNTVDLPSKGLLGYPAFAEYRDIMVKDEEVLSSATVETYAKTLNSVLKSVMNECDFYEKMCIHDRDFMLIWVWANNYSAVKTVEISCGSCGNKDEHKIDLTQLPQTDINEKIKKQFVLPIKKTGGSVTVRLNTVSDELMAEEVVRKNKNLKYESVMLALSIDLGINVPFDVKWKWITENMSGKEMAYVRQYHAHYAFGVDAVLKHSCSACGEVTHGAVPFQAEDVLFPTVSTDFEELL